MMEICVSKSTNTMTILPAAHCPADAKAPASGSGRLPVPIVPVQRAAENPTRVLSGFLARRLLGSR